MKIRFVLLFFGLLPAVFSFSQQKKDTVNINNTAVPADTSGKKIHSPRIAAIRSAVLPGWGQAYNRKYWKMPIVYGALGTTAYVFAFNMKEYKRVGFAYNVLVNRDTANFDKVDPDLLPFVQTNASSSLRNYRNTKRRDIDYSVIVFLLFWGLNVVDATVDAHLKGFDVSDNLSMKIKPGYNSFSNTTGVSFVLDIHKKTQRALVMNREF